MKKVQNAKPTKTESKAAFIAQSPSKSMAKRVQVQVSDETLPIKVERPSLNKFEFKGLPERAYSLNRYGNTDMEWRQMKDLAGIAFFIVGGWKKKDSEKLYLRVVTEDAPASVIHVSLPLGDNETRWLIYEQAAQIEEINKSGGQATIGPVTFVPIETETGTFMSLEMWGETGPVIDPDIPM